MVETLIIAAGVLVLGGLLVLERRCLGQMAVVQPLVVCLVAGWISGGVQAGLWLGVSLQLFSVALVRRIDWALAGTVAALALLAAPRFGVSLTAGGAGTLAAALVAALAGFSARVHELRAARIDGVRTRERSPFAESDPADAVERCVWQAVRRALLIGALEATVGTALAILAAWAVNRFGAFVGRVPLGPLVPAFAAAAALGALADRRLLLWTGLLAAAACAVSL